MIVQLTNERFEKFYLNSDLVEIILPVFGGKSEIKLTTGRFVVCIEPADKVRKIINDAMGYEEEEE